MKKILIISTITLVALFGLSQIDFSTNKKEYKRVNTSLKTETELKQYLKELHVNKEVNKSLTIKECKEQILPTKISDKLLTQIFTNQEKNNMNCKDIYLNILLKQKIAKIKELNENPTLRPPYYVKIPETLNIDYFDENTKTVKYFDYIDSFEGINVEKLSLADTEKHKVTRFPLSVNNQMFLDVGLFYFEDIINDPSIVSNEKRKHFSINKTPSIIENFPMKNLSFEFPKGKFQTLTLSRLSYNQKRISYIYENHSGEQKRIGTWQSVHIGISFDEKKNTLESYTKILLWEGTFILESENDKGVFYYVERKGE
jgi:hypothetical protein